MITTLDLSRHCLGYKTTAELVEIFTAIPTHVTTLNLSYNNFNGYTAAELATTLAIILSATTLLYLDFNSFNLITSTEYISILAAILAGIIPLRLWHNYANQNATAKLVTALAAIPTGVKKLELGQNCFNRKNTTAISQIFTPLLTRGISFDKETTALLGKHLPVHTLINAIQTLPATENLLGDSINPGFEIDNEQLPNIIAELQAIGSPLAYFTAGLLLSGMIEYSVDAVLADSPEFKVLFDQQVLQAVAFYIQVKEQDKTLQPRVDTLLWNFKYQYPNNQQLQDKLQELAPTPAAQYLPSYEKLKGPLQQQPAMLVNQQSYNTPGLNFT